MTDSTHNKKAGCTISAQSNLHFLDYRWRGAHVVIVPHTETETVDIDPPDRERVGKQTILLWGRHRYTTSARQHPFFLRGSE